MSKFILDSGDPEEYKVAVELAHTHNSEIWGSTTNPSLIAKKLKEQGKKFTMDQAFALQKDIVMTILELVPGAVSAEVYADSQTTSEEMVKQGKQIADWNSRVVIKLPTTVEGFKARTELRKANITTNNTLVFSQQQIYAISLHEHLMQKEFNSESKWPCFISPFLGRLDDIGEDGATLVKNGMQIKKLFPINPWMLSASIRNAYHIKQCIDYGSELITAPLSIYKDWFENDQQNVIQTQNSLIHPALWQPDSEIQSIQTVDEFMQAIRDGTLDITHPLTEKGIAKFTEDWKAILSD